MMGCLRGMVCVGGPECPVCKPHVLKMATLTAGPRGSEGDENHDGCMLPCCYTPWDGKRMVFREALSPWEHDERSFGRGDTYCSCDRTQQTWLCDGLCVRALPALGAAEFNAMQDVYRDLVDTGTGAYRLSYDEQADRAEIERINMTGARYRESVRTTPHGAEPWDHPAGECS